MQRRGSNRRHHPAPSGGAIFENLGGDLQIKTVNVGFAAYFEEIGRVGLISENKDNTMVSISGTKMREILGNGEMPDERIMRPSTAKVLVDFYAAKAAAAAEAE